MTIENPFVGSFCDERVVQIRFFFADDSTEMEAIAARNRIKDLAGMHAEEFLLQVLRNFLEQHFRVTVGITSLGRHVFHRHAVLARAKKRLPGGVERVQFDHLDFEAGQREAEGGDFSRARLAGEKRGAVAPVDRFHGESIAQPLRVAAQALQPIGQLISI